MRDRTPSSYKLSRRGDKGRRNRVVSVWSKYKSIVDTCASRDDDTSPCALRAMALHCVFSFRREGGGGPNERMLSAARDLSSEATRERCVTRWAMW